MKYAIIWEYIVREEAQSAFEKAYHPEGLWAEIFKMADGYLSTELYHDVENDRRFVTVDYWVSPEAVERFHGRFGQVYQDLDIVCTEYTEAEKLVGRFWCV